MESILFGEEGHHGKAKLWQKATTIVFGKHTLVLQIEAG